MLVGTNSVTAVDGVATFTNSGLAGIVGTYALTFTGSVGGSPRAVTQTIDLVAGAPSRYLITSSATSAAAGTTVTLSAQLVDASDNRVAGDGVVTWARSGMNGSFSAPTSTTNASGLATVSFTMATVINSSTAQLSATDASNISGTTSVTAVSGPASQLVWSQSPVAAGYGVVLSSTVVSVTDQYGNVVISDARSVRVRTAPGTVGTLSGTATISAVAGVTTFTGLWLDKAETGVRLVAEPVNAGLLSTTTGAFDVAPIGVLRTVSGGTIPSLATDSMNVYYHVTTNLVQGLNRTPVVGGATTPLTNTGPSGGYLSRMFYDGGRVGVALFEQHSSSYTSRYVSSPVDGAGVTITDLRPFNCAPLSDLEFDATSVFIGCIPVDPCLVGVGAPSLVRVSRGDAAVTTFAPSTMAVTTTVSNGFLYFVNDSIRPNVGLCQAGSVTGIHSIRRRPASGGSLEVMVESVGTVGTSWSLAIVGGTMYWVENRGTSNGWICMAPATPGATTAQCIAGFSSSTNDLRPDGQFIYFIDAGSIKRMSLIDFSVTTVVSAAEAAMDFVLDTKSIYWTSNTSTSSVTSFSVKKTAKP